MAASKHTTSITTGLAYSYWSVQTLDAQKTGRDWPVMSPYRKLDESHDEIAANHCHRIRLFQLTHVYFGLCAMATRRQKCRWRRAPLPASPCLSARAGRW